MSSLLYYVLIEQYIRSVEVYSRVENTDVWMYQTVEDPDDGLVFARLVFELTADAINDGIDLSAPEEKLPEPPLTPYLCRYNALFYSAFVQRHRFSWLAATGQRQ